MKCEQIPLNNDLTKKPGPCYRNTSVSPADTDVGGHLYGDNTASHQRKLDMDTRDISTIKAVLLTPEKYFQFKKLSDILIHVKFMLYLAPYNSSFTTRLWNADFALNIMRDIEKYKGKQNVVSTLKDPASC